MDRYKVEPGTAMTPPVIDCYTILDTALVQSRVEILTFSAHGKLSEQRQCNRLAPLLLPRLVEGGTAWPWRMSPRGSYILAVPVGVDAVIDVLLNRQASK
jgi:hypothetical protein